MRCNYRCNMWCNCKKPAKPYPATPSISAPTVESLELTPNSGQDINFTYTPTDAELSVSITSSDTNVVQTFPLVYENGSARFNAMGIDEGDTTITITNDDNPSETYSVAVHVENEEPFVPANNIIVDVESEGEATVRKTKSKKVRGSGDTYHARVFAEEYESADYVQLNWGYLATPDVSYIGKTASDEHCVNMFTTDVINNIARNIETLHDGGQLGGSCEFEDVAWLNIQSYFDAPYSQESAEQLIAQLSEGEIIEPISSGVTISGLDGYYFEIPYTQGVTEVVYYTPADGDISNLVATVDDPSMVSVNFAWNDNGLAYYTIAALTDSGCTAVRFTDGENTYACDVCCMPFVHVDSISSPSLSEVSVAQGTTKHSYFSYTPEYSSAPTNDITVNPNNVSYSWRCDGGVSDFDIYYRGTDGDGTISYYLNSAPETVYTITVHNVTPTTPIESLSGIPSEVAHLAPETGRTFIVTYLPEDADEIESQIQVTYDDPSIVGVGIRNVDTGAHTFLVDYFGKAEGYTNVYFYLNGALVAETGVTIERPTIQTISNLQYTNPTQDGGEVYSRGYHTPVTFEYTPTKGAGGLTVTKTGGTKVDGTAWDAPGRDADQSISTEGIDYNNGVATLECYVDNEASVGQRGSWRIAVENDPNQYLDVKITYANEPAPSTDCTITVAVNDNTMGSVDIPSVTVPVGTSISYNGNQVTIGSTTVTATANTGYQQRGWSNMIFTATENATIMAEFEAIPAQTPVESIEIDPDTEFTQGLEEIIGHSLNYSPMDANDFSSVEIVSDDESIATASGTAHDLKYWLTIVGHSFGSTYVHVYIDGVEQGEVYVTIQGDALQSIDSIDITNATEAGDEGYVFSRGTTASDFVSFYYTPSSADPNYFSIQQIGGTRVDGSDISADPDSRVDVSITIEEISYNSGVGHIQFYVDRESQYGQYGTFEITNGDDPSNSYVFTITLQNPNPTLTITTTDGDIEDWEGTASFPAALSFGNSIQWIQDYNSQHFQVSNADGDLIQEYYIRFDGVDAVSFTPTINGESWPTNEYSEPEEYIIRENSVIAVSNVVSPIVNLTMTTTEGTIVDGDGNEVSFPLSVISGNEISRDGVSFFVRDGGTLSYENVIAYNGVLGVSCDATVNGEPWPTDDETGDPTSVIVEGNITIAASNIEWPSTNIGIDESGINGTVTRTGNGWVQNDETGLREVQGLVSDTTITPSGNSGIYTLTIDDGQDTNTLEIVPDNFDDYVYRGLDDGLEITQSVNIKDLPGFGETTCVYPSTITPDPEAQ